MIELVLLACLVDQPESCRDVGLTYSAENLTPMQCLMQAPPQMARWVGEHPGWKIMKWSCRRAGTLRQDVMRTTGRSSGVSNLI